MKIKTTKEHRFGRTCETSEGSVSFDNEGVAEINDASFDNLKLIMRDIVAIDGDSEQKGKSKTSKKADESSEGNGSTSTEGNGSTAPVDNSKDSLDKKMALLSEEELFEIASGIEGANVKSLKKMGKDELLAYVKENMKVN